MSGVAPCFKPSRLVPKAYEAIAVSRSGYGPPAFAHNVTLDQTIVYSSPHSSRQAGTGEANKGPPVTGQVSPGLVGPNAAHLTLCSRTPRIPPPTELPPCTVPYNISV